MLLLSSLLGPAKPPVASREDVASASGTYCVQRSGENLFAIATHGLGQIRIVPSERCLVCLEDYEVEEEVRQLTKCSHLFHRECIDQVCHYAMLRSLLVSMLMCYSASGLLQVVILALSVEAKASTRGRKASQRVDNHLRLAVRVWHLEHSQGGFINSQHSISEGRMAYGKGWMKHAWHMRLASCTYPYLQGEPSRLEI